VAGGRGGYGGNLVIGFWFLVVGFWLRIDGARHMATIQRFEDIEAWQKARELSREIYACSNCGGFAKDYGLKDQIRRAAISIMSNIAEGFERDGKAEFLHFLSIAKGSVGEVEAQLFIALDQGYIERPEFERLKAMALSTKKLIAGFMGYLRQCSHRGQKFKEPTRNQKPETRNQKPETRNQKQKNP
jgi:four helix bundle protein